MTSCQFSLTSMSLSPPRSGGRARPRPGTRGNNSCDLQFINKPQFEVAKIWTEPARVPTGRGELSLRVWRQEQQYHQTQIQVEVATQCLIHVDLTDSRRLGDPDLEEAGGDTVAAHMLNMLRDMRTRSNSQSKITRFHYFHFSGWIDSWPASTHQDQGLASLISPHLDHQVRWSDHELMWTWSGHNNEYMMSWLLHRQHSTMEGNYEKHWINSLLHIHMKWQTHLC